MGRWRGPWVPMQVLLAIAAVGAASGVGTGIAVGVAGKVASMGSAAIAASRSRSPRSVIFPFPVPLSACVFLSCPTTVALSIFGVELNIFFAAFQKFRLLTWFGNLRRQEIASM